MTKLAELQTRHAKILRTFNQVESVLSPIHTGTGKKDCITIWAENIERLAKQSDLLSNDFCTIKVTSEKVGQPGQGNQRTLYKIDLTGENFGYSFAPESLPGLMKAIEKSFKEAESFTKKAIKEDLSKGRVNIPAPEPMPEKPVKNEIKAIAPAPEKLITAVNKLKKDKTISVKKQYNSYICDMGKTVILQIENKYIDQIKAGKKTEDYRSISAFNTKLLCDNVKENDLKKGEAFVQAGKQFYRPKTSIERVRFVNGYKTDRKELTCEIKGIYIDKFLDKIPDGMKPGAVMFTIELGKIVELKNF